MNRVHPDFLMKTACTSKPPMLFNDVIKKDYLVRFCVTLKTSQINNVDDFKVQKFLRSDL